MESFNKKLNADHTYCLKKANKLDDLLDKYDFKAVTQQSKDVNPSDMVHEGFSPDAIMEYLLAIKNYRAFDEVNTNRQRYQILYDTIAQKQVELKKRKFSSL